MDDAALAFMAAREAELVALCRDLVAAPSANPPGPHRRGRRVLAVPRPARVAVETLARDPEKPNLVATPGGWRERPAPRPERPPRHHPSRRRSRLERAALRADRAGRPAPRPRHGQHEGRARRARPGFRLARGRSGGAGAAASRSRRSRTRLCSGRTAPLSCSRPARTSRGDALLCGEGPGSWNWRWPRKGCSGSPRKRADARPGHAGDTRLLADRPPRGVPRRGRRAERGHGGAARRGGRSTPVKAGTGCACRPTSAPCAAAALSAKRPTVPWRRSTCACRRG